jgi:single-strand DNA-binding protein
MANFNKVILMGNLTRDPQLSYLPSQTAVVDFGLAVNRNWTGQDGQKKQEVCFVDCRAFGKTAETINKYCKKGNPLLIEGRLTFDQWTTQEGQKRSKHRITVVSFQFLPAGGSGGGEQSSSPDPEQESSGNYGSENNAQSGNDDIPF